MNLPPAKYRLSVISIKLHSNLQRLKLKLISFEDKSDFLGFSRPFYAAQKFIGGQCVIEENKEITKLSLES